MNNIIGSKIKDLRTKLEICQQDLCNDILSRTVLSKIENGKVTPSIFQLKHIAQRLNVSIDYLISDSTEQLDMPIENNISNSLLNKLYEDQRYYQIIMFYEKELFKNIKDINLNFYVGYSYYSTEFYKNAALILKRYLSNYLNLDSAERDPYVINFAIALNTLSKMMLTNSNYDKAIHYCSLAKKHLEMQNKTHIRIYHLIISNIGAIYCMANNYVKCIDVLEDFLNKNKDLGFLKILPNMHLSLNIAYYNIGEYKKSIKNIENAIFLYNYSGRNYDAKHCYLNYINALRYCKQFDEAFRVLEQYKIMYSDSKELKPNFSIQEIILYFNIGKYDIAKKLLEQVKTKDLSPLNKNSYFFIKAHIFYLEKNITQSLYLFQKCEKYFSKHNYTYDLSLIYDDLFQITNNLDYKNKAEYYKQKDGKKNIIVT